MATHTPRFDRCPSCRRHVRPAAHTQPNICPFCHASMTQAQTHRQFPGRGGMLATSLLSAGLVGWDTPSVPSDADETPPEPIPEAIEQPLYGMPTPIPIYGIPSPPIARWALSIEGTFGLGAQTQSEKTSRSTDPLVALTPALDRIINRHVAVGLELGVAWLGNPDGAVDTRGTALNRTQVFTPNLRIHLTWPIVFDRFHLTTTLAGGVAFWRDNGSDSIDVPTESNRLGFGLRANVGGAFMIDEAVDIFLTVGYFATSALSEDVSLSHTAFPANLGLRFRFGR